jgi:hypothetical protein
MAPPLNGRAGAITVLTLGGWLWGDLMLQSGLLLSLVEHGLLLVSTMCQSVEHWKHQQRQCTTVASGCCTSAPVPVAIAIGTKPKDATSAVMSTGRRRVSAPS